MSYAKLRGRVREKYGTQAAFAKAMGKDAATISGKMTGRVEWTRGEMEKACALLDISVTDMHLYFFG